MTGGDRPWGPPLPVSPTSSSPITSATPLKQPSQTPACPDQSRAVTELAYVRNPWRCRPVRRNSRRADRSRIRRSVILAEDRGVRITETIVHFRIRGGSRTCPAPLAGEPAVSTSRSGDWLTSREGRKATRPAFLGWPRRHGSSAEIVKARR